MLVVQWETTSSEKVAMDHSALKQRGHPSPSYFCLGLQDESGIRKTPEIPRGRTRNQIPVIAWCLRKRLEPHDTSDQEGYSCQQHRRPPTSMQNPRFHPIPFRARTRMAVQPPDYRAIFAVLSEKPCEQCNFSAPRREKRAPAAVHYLVTVGEHSRKTITQS
ncbi:hypothetical protein OG21DRAFT_345041 [Imleria badia]|nr:hypothetical protein OG21DRAFT_345041 [Imleria badia]